VQKLRDIQNLFKSQSLYFLKSVLRLKKLIFQRIRKNCQNQRSLNEKLSKRSQLKNHAQIKRMKISSTGLKDKNECLRLRSSIKCRNLGRLTFSYRKFWTNPTVLPQCSSIIVLRKRRRNETLLKKWKKWLNRHFFMKLKLIYQNNLRC